MVQWILRAKCARPENSVIDGRVIKGRACKGSDASLRVARCALSVVVVDVSDATMEEQCLCQQSPMNCAREPSMAKNSSPSRAPKTGAQHRDNPEERNKCGKSAKNPINRPIAIHTATSVPARKTASAAPPNVFARLDRAHLPQQQRAQQQPCPRTALSGP